MTSKTNAPITLKTNEDTYFSMLPDDDLSIQEAKINKLKNEIEALKNVNSKLRTENAALKSSKSHPQEIVYQQPTVVDTAVIEKIVGKKVKENLKIMQENVMNEIKSMFEVYKITTENQIEQNAEQTEKRADSMVKAAIALMSNGNHTNTDIIEIKNNQRSLEARLNLHAIEINKFGPNMNIYNKKLKEFEDKLDKVKEALIVSVE